MQAEPLTILLDVDDVTAQFRKRFFEIANEEMGTNYTIDDLSMDWDCDHLLFTSEESRSRVWNVVFSRGFAETLELTPGVGDVIESLASRHEVVFLTHQCEKSETWVVDRTRWIEKHFGVVLASRTVFTSQKYLVDGDIFVDDRPHHLTSWQERRLLRNKSGLILPITYAWPYNVLSPTAIRTNDWEDIRKVIETCTRSSNG